MDSKGTQPYIYMYPFSPQTPLPSRLLHNIEQNSLCCIVGLCWLSILNIAECTCWSQTPYLFPHSSPPPETISSFSKRLQSFYFYWDPVWYILVNILWALGKKSLFFCCWVVKWSEVTQSCPALSDPIDGSLLDTSAHGIFQARVLEWVAIAFSGCWVEWSINIY